MSRKRQLHVVTQCFNTTQHNSELYRKFSPYEHQNYRCKFHSYFRFLVFKSVSLPGIFTRSSCHWLGVRSHFWNIKREPHLSLVSRVRPVWHFQGQLNHYRALDSRTRTTTSSKFSLRTTLSACKPASFWWENVIPSSFLVRGFAKMLSCQNKPWTR